MSLTWHILRKDLFRLRWIVLLLVVCVASQLGLAALEAGLDVVGHMPFYMASWAFGFVFAPVISFGLVMGLQDDDPVAGGDAFWMTRPIDGWRLLAAKTAALALLAAVPVAVDLPFWALHGFGPALLGDAILNRLKVQGYIAMLALPFAIISPNGSRFVMNVMIAGASLVGLTLLCQLWAPLNTTAPTASILQSRSFLILTIWAVATAAMGFNQYCRRETRTSVAILVAAIVAALFVSERWNGTLGSSLGKAHSGDEGPRVTLVVAAEAGSRVVTAGFEMKIIEIIPNDPRGGVAVELSESAPDLPLWNTFSAAPLSPEHYTLVNRTDGRRMVGEATRNPEELGAAGLRFFRTSLLFRPDRDLAGNVPANIVPWLKDADLVKAIAPASAFGSAGAKESTPRPAP